LAVGDDAIVMLHGREWHSQITGYKNAMLTYCPRLQTVTLGLQYRYPDLHWTSLILQDGCVEKTSWTGGTQSDPLDLINLEHVANRIAVER